MVKPDPHASRRGRQSDTGVGRSQRQAERASRISAANRVSQIVVQPFPDPAAGKWQVSMNGGAYPRWRRDGRELYHVAANGDLVAVSVTPGTTFSVGTSAVLFRTNFGFTGQPLTGAPYDVRADGERFLLAVSPDDPNATPIRTVVNWPSLAKGKSSAK